MPGRDDPEKYLRWRVAVGDPGGRRRWPLVMRGSRLTEIPGRGVPARGAMAAGPPPGGAARSGAGRGEPYRAWHLMFVGRMAVAARSVSWLRHLLDHPVTLTRVRRVTVVVQDWQIPQRGWSGRLGPLPHLLAQRVSMPRYDQGRAVVEIELRWSVPLRTVLVAVLPLFAPVRPLPTPASPEVTAQDVLPGWLGAGPNLGAVAGELPGRMDVRPYDVVLRPDDRTPPVADGGSGPAYRTRLTVDRLGVEAEPTNVEADPADAAAATVAVAVSGATCGAGGRVGPVLIDAEHAVPVGRYGPFGPDAPRAELVFPAEPDGGGWRIQGPGGLDCRGRLDRPWLTEETRSALTGIGVLDCRSVPGRQPRAEAALLLHLALTGVLVHAPGLGPDCRAHLSDEVVDLIGAALPDPPGTAPERHADLAREVRAVRQRRAVLRRHARGLALSRLTATAFPGLGELPSVSALLVTRRLRYVLDAVAVIEAQTYPRLEIVLCLHGVGLPADLRARLTRCGRPLEVVEVPGRHSFGAAIGAATARSRGSLLTKFDDDDTYGPEHVWDLVLARHHSAATMVGKAAEFVYLGTLDTTVRRDAGAAESFAPLVAGGTILIGRGDLEEIGGWRPVPRSIDRGLIDRVRRAGGLIYRTHPLGYVYQRRSAGHTWDPGLEYFLRDGGAQWTGLPRHSEFGTASREEYPPGRSGVAAGQRGPVRTGSAVGRLRSSAGPTLPGDGAGPERPAGRRLLHPE